MQVCEPTGRDCIERNSIRTFNCSSTCEGIYATVQWVGKGIDEDLDGQKIVEKGGGDTTPLEKRLASLEKKMKMIENDRDGKGDEVDAEKYKMLIAEYKSFKRRNLQHVRFQPEEGLVFPYGKC